MTRLTILFVAFDTEYRRILGFIHSNSDSYFNTSVMFTRF